MERQTTEELPCRRRGAGSSRAGSQASQARYGSVHGDEKQVEWPSPFPATARCRHKHTIHDGGCCGRPRVSGRRPLARRPAQTPSRKGSSLVSGRRHPDLFPRSPVCAPGAPREHASMRAWDKKGEETARRATARTDVQGKGSPHPHPSTQRLSIRLDLLVTAVGIACRGLQRDAPPGPLPLREKATCQVSTAVPLPDECRPSSTSLLIAFCPRPDLPSRRDAVLDAADTGDEVRLAAPQRLSTPRRAGLALSESPSRACVVARVDLGSAVGRLSVYPMAAGRTDDAPPPAQS